ncbi:MAG: PhoH family protein [Acetobacter sp.]|nr:PhoH family protein [Acetobacter sp.]
MKNKIIKFYDTCALLEAGERVLEMGEHFAVSSITFKELERIKTSSNKDPDTKYSARLLLRLLDGDLSHGDTLEDSHKLWTCVLHKPAYEEKIKEFDINDDTRILSDAIYYQQAMQEKDIEVQFITNDLSLKCIATSIFNGPVLSIKEEVDSYLGYKDIEPDADTLMRFYQEPNENVFNLRRGEYLVLRQEDKIVDVRVWTGEEYRHLKYTPFISKWFGKVVPYENDIYQKLYCDSLCSNKITMVRGPAGSGKTYLSIAYLMSLMDKGKIDKIIIFCNTVATVDSAKLGYYPGSKDEKLLDSQIGNLLMSKFGGREGVEQLMSEGKLMLLPFSDIRGFDTTGMNAGIYITEAQNLNRTLMKLALQRIGEDCICIIDGDDNSQVDMKAYEGSNNGMKRLSKIFRGHDIYGEVKLQNIYRSKIAEIADAI